jgi:predicted ATPase/DNA-binding winged helix-turn-helix (wHTH) protein
MPRARDTSESLAFGRFRVMPDRREVWADAEPVKLGPRAFELLMALIETPGAMLSKDDLVTRLWPGRTVTENSLHAQISALRQTLGEERDLIRTVAGRGYRFVGEIHVVPSNPGDAAPAGRVVAADSVKTPPGEMPRPFFELIGRDAEVAEVAELVWDHRLVTLTGTGGIGKTRLALEVSRRLRERFPEGVRLAEFSPLADPRLVPATVAAAAGLELAGELSARRVAQALAARHMLVVLDTCEHVVDAATTMAEAAVRFGTACHVIVTSREPLHAEGEQLYQVAPLEVPPDDVVDVLDAGAARLFVERARAAGARLQLDRNQVTAISAICRHLDGIPLAIEMAAARVAALGVEELAGRLGGRLGLLTGGRRTAPPRHQTLRATLDWSHELLPGPERVILRRLAVFAGSFSLEAAGAVVASPEISPLEAVDGISSLVEKSLVVAELDRAVPRYRLLDTTRAYALEKLAESGEREQLAGRHAEYYQDFFEQAEAGLEIGAAPDWLDDHGWHIGNLRAALDWAFSRGGNLEIGVALTAAAVPLWAHSSLLEECRDRVEQALAALAEGGAGDPRREMKLHAALGLALTYASDATLPAIGVAWGKSRELAESLGDVEYQLRSLQGLWFANAASGRHGHALAAAQTFHVLAAGRPDPNDRLGGERLIGLSRQLLGDQPRARRHLEHVVAQYVPPIQTSHIMRFQGDQRVTANTFLGRALWLQGLPDQATRTIERSVDDARVSNHAISLGYVLANAACPVALWIGDLDVASHYVEMLIEHSTRHALTRWRAFGLCHQGVLVIRRGDASTGSRLLRSGLGELGESNASFRFIVCLGELAEALGRIGQIDEGLSEVTGAIARAEETEERWGIAELLRGKGELLLLQGAPGAEESAKNHFQQALVWARQQGALSWELRAAMSMARLRRDQGRSADGLALLQPVYDRFTEGFQSADLKAARVLMHELRA